MKILLTGSTGMVGKNILENESLAIHTILSPSRDELNLFNYEQVRVFLKKHKPDFIIHCAGRVGGIQANIKNPVSFLVENMDMGRNIIMAACEEKVPKLLNLASSCMYPREATNPLKEEMILQGELEPTNEGYALAKIFAQRLCAYISKQYPNLDYKTIVPCNLYGRWDKFDPENSHMIPAVITKIHQAKIENKDTVDIWGDGLARREFMYVGDLATIVAFVVEKFEQFPSVFNAGLGHDYSIKEYYQTVAKVIGYKGNFTFDLTKPVGMKQKLVDISILKSQGLKNLTSLEDGIKKTYDFFLEYKK